MGGSKKKSTKVAPKRKPKLPTAFDCPFCSRAQTVSVSMSRQTLVGHVKCGACGVSYRSRINSLSQPVDVFADWVDACHAVRVHKAKLAEGDK